MSDAAAASAAAAPAAPSGTGSKTPADFLKSIKGRPVIVKLNSGSDYRGEIDFSLASIENLDGFSLFCFFFFSFCLLPSTYFTKSKRRTQGPWRASTAT